MGNNDNNLIIQIKKLLEPILDENDLELVYIEYRSEGNGCVLRVYIDKENGVTVDDCSGVSKELGMLLDIHEVITNSYSLEVSSPGLDRQLRGPKDYKRFIGRRIKVKLSNPINKQYVLRMAKLAKYENDKVFIEFQGDNFDVPLSNILKANLELDF